MSRSCCDETAGPYLWRVSYLRRKQMLVVRADTAAEAVSLVIAHVQDRTGSATAPDEWRATRLREIGPIGVVR